MADLKVTIDGIEHGKRIPETFAFGIRTESEKFTFGPNRNPSIEWERGPEGTKSYAIIMHDRSVPTVFDDANQEGRTIPASLARMDFMHWILVDIPANVTSIAEGRDSDGVTAKGKPVGPAGVGVRGANDFDMFMAGNPDMAGTYGGYDGPAPPWNDELMHEYVFTVYALDIPSLGLEGEFKGKDALKAMGGHVLAQGRVVGLYSLNPDLG